MKKILMTTAIVSTILTSATPTTLWAAPAKKVSIASVKQSFVPVKLLNASAVDQHLYYIFTGELLVSDTGTSKQVSIVVGNQVIDARYKSTREDGKEVWGFSLGFNRNQLFADDALTFVIRYKSGGKTYWDANPNYKLTDESNIIFGDTSVKLEKASYDWTFNSVNGTIVTKNLDKAQGVTITYSTDGWRTRDIAIAKFQETDKATGLKHWSFSLPTDSENLNVQYFVVLNTPKKTYIDNNAGLGYNIYR